MERLSWAGRILLYCDRTWRRQGSLGDGGSRARERTSVGDGLDPSRVWHWPRLKKRRTGADGWETERFGTVGLQWQPGVTSSLSVTRIGMSCALVNPLTSVSICKSTKVQSFQNVTSTSCHTCSSLITHQSQVLKMCTGAMAFMTSFNKQCWSLLLDVLSATPQFA